ncbi:hypothetical protein ACFWVC_31230 [Streptomyces sp. NPDC058691]|uniref:hypothetical protein n=1 Tax=Streptomyces sp. NPDC058691 TaxID=3346601 RepID=UPI00364B54E1
MRGDTFRALPRVPGVIALACLLGALGAAWFLIAQLRAADRIDTSPVRVRGVVERVTASGRGGGRDVRVGYELAGHHFSDTGLPDRKMPEHLAVGDSLCLEAAGRHPGTVRLCGQRYPAGDDMPPTAILVLAAATAGLLCAAGFAVSGLRARRSGAAGPDPLAAVSR